MEELEVEETQKNLSGGLDESLISEQGLEKVSIPEEPEHDLFHLLAKVKWILKRKIKKQK